MTNIVLTNLPSKRALLDEFMRSRGITNFIIFTEATEISELLNDMLTTSQDTFNLHVFDFFGDISLVNAIRDYRDQINVLRVYVANVEEAKPFLTLTDDVFLLPQFNILSMFWDCEAFRASNVMAFDATHADYYKIKRPGKLGRTDSLVVNIHMQNIPLRYKTASGSIVETMGPQLIVDCNAKVSDVRDKFEIRKQKEVYNHEPRNLKDLAVSSVDDEQEAAPTVKQEKPEKSVEKKLEKPEKVKKTKKPEETLAEDSAVQSVFTANDSAVGDKKRSGFTSFFAKFIGRDQESEEQEPEEVKETESTTSVKKTSALDDLFTDDEPEAEVTDVEDEETATDSDEPAEEEKEERQPVRTNYIGFGNVKGGTEVAVEKARVHRYTLEEIYESISEYCIKKEFISAEDGSALIREIGNKQSKDVLFGNLALERGLITEEQLIAAITEVNHIEVLTWDAIKSMELDFTYFSIEKCQEYKFFKLKDTRSTDRVRIVCACSMPGIHPEIRRLFNSPQISYTLDSYVKRKLEEVNT